VGRDGAVFSVVKQLSSAPPCARATRLERGDIDALIMLDFDVKICYTVYVISIIKHKTSIKQA
jgi:hypothetical protein